MKQYLKRALVMLAVLIITIATIVITKRHFVIEKKKLVSRIAESIAVSLPKSELIALPDRVESLGMHNCPELRSRMIDIVTINKKARYAYVYILRDSRIFFVADSEPESSSDYTPSGTEYFEATEVDKKQFENGRTEVTPEPFTDRWGTWISIGVPIKDEMSGHVIAIFGMDYDAKLWSQTIVFELLEHVTIELMIITLFFISFWGFSKNKALKEEIRQRELVEVELIIASERSRLAVENSGVGVWDWKINEGELFYSPQVATIIGWQNHKFSNHIKEFLKLIHHCDQRRVMQDFRRYFKGLTDSFISEFQIETHIGSYKWVLLNSKVVEYNEKAKPKRILGIITDVDIRKRNEIALVESLKQEKELNDLKSKFVSMASHEFRTPLASILLAAETLKCYNDRLSPEAIDQKIKRIESNVFFLSSMVEKVLNLTHVESGKIKVVPTSFHLPNLITSIIDEFRITSSSSHIIKYEFEDPECYIKADKQMINQSISNLISNSIKYSPIGSVIFVELTIIESEITISVSDQGIGISKEDEAKIFEPFFRGSNTVNIRGTGLGLSLTHQFIQLHKGEITFRSSPGFTIFTIKIPQIALVEDKVVLKKRSE